MLRFQVNRNAVRGQDPLQPVGELLTDSLLHREPAREQPHQPGQLGPAQNVLMRDVPNVGLAEERQAVVLAPGKERYQPFDDLTDAAVRSAAALGRERLDQLFVPSYPLVASKIA
jgi:hypothetical protein